MRDRGGGADTTARAQGRGASWDLHEAEEHHEVRDGRAELLRPVHRHLLPPARPAHHAIVRRPYSARTSRAGAVGRAGRAGLVEGVFAAAEAQEGVLGRCGGPPVLDEALGAECGARPLYADLEVARPRAARGREAHERACHLRAPVARLERERARARAEVRTKIRRQRRVQRRR